MRVNISTVIMTILSRRQMAEAQMGAKGKGAAHRVQGHLASSWSRHCHKIQNIIANSKILRLSSDNSGPCNSVNYLGHSKMSLDDDDDDDDDDKHLFL